MQFYWARRRTGRSCLKFGISLLVYLFGVVVYTFAKKWEMKEDGEWGLQEAAYQHAREDAPWTRR